MDSFELQPQQEFIEGYRCFEGVGQRFGRYLLGYVAFPLSDSVYVKSYLQHPTVDVSWYPLYGIPPLVIETSANFDQEFDATAYLYVGVDLCHAFNVQDGTCLDHGLLLRNLKEIIEGVKEEKSKNEKHA